MAMPDGTLGGTAESPFAALTLSGPTQDSPRPYPAIPRALDRLSELTEYLAKAAQMLDERTIVARIPSEEKWAGADAQPQQQPTLSAANHECCDRIETTLHRLQGISSEIQL